MAQETEFKPDWPRFFWHRGVPIVYEIKLKANFAACFHLKEVTRAIIDASTQYQADGLRWKAVDDPWMYIPAHWVEGWREIE